MAMSPEAEKQLAEDISGFYADPLGFVLYAFPWGVPGTALEDHDGPDQWQAAQLDRVGRAIQEDPLTTIQEATASGHGIGKSAETSWVILWAMSTRPDLAGVVTANTQNQLKSKTWRELALWHKRAINGHWFEWTATRFFHKEHPDTWGVDAIPNTEHNSEAFAGLHAEHVLVIYDEASAIPDKIWEVTEGAMTTPRAMWFAYGNPTVNTGRFRECFGKFKHRWVARNIDARTCKMTNKAKLQEWLDDHGEDSDFFRVRVRGEFPRSGSTQLIGTGIVEDARRRELEMDEYHFMPLVIGVDVARFGDDQTVITVRQGRKIHYQKKYRQLRNTAVAAYASAEYRKFQSLGAPMGPIFVDGIGVGAGVVDILSASRYPVVDVGAGEAAEEKKRYYNKRIEMWDRMKEWLEAGADIPDDSELQDDLVGPQYGFKPGTEKMFLESKEDMKARGLASPDCAESVAVTFAEHVMAPPVAAGGHHELGYDSVEPDVV